MINIVNKFFLAGDKFIPELYPRQSGFIYRTCGSFTKHPKTIQQFRETGNLKHIYKKEPDKPFTLIMLHILIVKTLRRELFQIRFWKIGLMKLL